MSLRIQDPVFYIPVTFPLLFFYEPIIKNRIQDRFLYSRYIPVTFLLGTNPSSRIQERTRHQEFKIKERDYENVKRGQRMNPSSIKERDYENVKRGQRRNEPIKNESVRSLSPFYIRNLVPLS